MFSSSLKRERKFSANRILTLILLGFFIFSFLLTPVHVSQAQLVTADTQTTTQTVLSKVWDTLKKLLVKAGSFAFQRTLSSALNKIAYDSASYIGSGGQGQHNLYTLKGWGEELAGVGDEAAGQFVETFANQLSTDNFKSTAAEGCSKDYAACMENCKPTNLLAANPNLTLEQQASQSQQCAQNCNSGLSSCDEQNKKINGAISGQTATGSSKLLSTAASIGGGMVSSFNVCQPSSIDAKVKITLGLVEQSRPSAPSCKATDIVKNWSTAANFKNPNFLDEFKDMFDPRGNDLGVYVNARTDLGMQADAKVEVKKTELSSNQGWLDVRDIAGNIKGTPGAAKQASTDAADAKKSGLGKTTGDIFVDAANVFLNQLAISAFNNLMQNLGKKSSDINNAPGGNGGDSPLKNSETDINIVYGESNLKEIISTSLGPKFSTRTDYDVLSQLAICLDEKNPGPVNCVIDSKFMQGITERKTVAEAIKEGYLNGDWQLTLDPMPDSYSLRNISILRKYRILPLGWEVAINKAFEDPAHQKKVTLNDLVSCFSTTDQYNKFSSDFDIRDQGWCQGLVDPNWVLKAPLNYCKKQGVSAQIINKDIIPGIKGVAGAANVLSTLGLTRAEDYCADEQTCVKEKNDGSCESYGYCDEEKRTWNFGSDSCQAVYNTCRTFNGLSGQVSYLENTLNYGDCSPENAGCRQYSLFGSYASSTGAVSWDANKSLYLNKNTSDCNPSDEGCTELTRVKPTWGANLLMDSDFSNEEVGASSTAGSMFNDWPYWSVNADVSTRKLSIVDAGQEPGGATGKALKMEVMGTGGQAVVGTYSNHDQSLFPDNLQILAGQAYTVSADVYLAEGHIVSLFIGPASDGVIAATGVQNKWQHLTVTRQSQNFYNEPEFGINADIMNAGQITVYIKNIKFEMSPWDTGYSAYGSSYQVHEKLLPAYLENSCYTDATSATKDYRLKNNAPAACFSYARKCNQAEVGCELYTAAKDGFTVPAQVQTTDYCPSECLNYDVYISKENYFDSPQAENLIPENSKACTSQAVGCNEFTNLDSLTQGGEDKEYYSSLKQCIKPGQGTCDSFYSWEGTNNGYQLKLYTLEKDTLTNLPKVTSNDSSLCNAQIYHKPVGDPAYNPDCREFYNTAGQVAYHLLERTITCSDNCHAYRLSGTNPDKRLTQAQCTGTDKHWDNSSSACLVCLNGGTWDTNHSACVYQAIPGEGKKCQAAEKGCREYNGNGGNNVRLAAYYDFESGRSGWSSNCSGGIGISTISNDKNGHSLLYNSSASNCMNIGELETQYQAFNGHRLIETILAAATPAAQVKLGTSVTQGLAYNVKFIAQAANDANLQIYFYNKDTGQKAYFNASSTLTVKGGGEWAVYQANLENLDHEVGANEFLIITADKPFYFDNFVLSEVTDRYYLIKNSSQIPGVCYYDNFDNYQGADFNLGCSQYSDRGNLKHNLHKFSKLCSNSAVGCEQMIDTKNYAPYGPGIWNDTNQNGQCDAAEPDCVRVPGDSSLYAIYDENKQCNVADLGCSRLGQAKGSGSNIAWSDVFKKNNPNLYSKNLCGQEAVGCEEWVGTDNNQSSYFKDPGNNVCVYRQSQDPTATSKAWYKMPVKRCDSNSNGKIDAAEKNGSICAAVSDCNNKPCILDNNDYPCSTSYLKTFGLGGGSNQIPTPDQAAGLCEANASGCTEYLDPVSKFSANLVYNPSYQVNGSSYEGWGASSGQKWNGQNISNDQQVIKLEPNKIYIFTTISENNNVGEVKLDFVSGVKPLLSDNTLGTSTNSLIIPDNGPNLHLLFYSLNNSKALVTGGVGGKTIEVKEAVIDYQLQNNIDKQSCNGQVKFDNGCVLFNERKMNGGQGLASLVNGWDPYATIDGQSPVTCSPTQPDSCLANQLIKVRPDRTCSKWLDCLTYVLDPTTNTRTCYAVGECDRLNDKNECASFTDVSTTSIRQFDALRDKNATGYSVIDKYYLSQMKEVGLNSAAHYNFEDTLPTLSCKTVSGNTCIFNKNIVADSLIREPEGAPTDYPANGKTYLKVPSKYLISPQSSNAWTSVITGKDYYINYLVNTKNSGVGTKLIIKGRGNNNTVLDVATFTDSGNSGWERKIHKFTTTSPVNKIQIYLGSDDSTKDGFVYFDDINIEPVLEVAPDEYIARECRLYPTNDSLTCFNKNNNVIADGLEGYCLQHDSRNKDVCLMWYPIDRIAAARSGQQTLGYNGKFPLNYCTELNGNFDLLEKRWPKLVGLEGCWNDKDDDWQLCSRSGARAFYYGTDQRDYEIGSWNVGQINSGSFVGSKRPDLVRNYCGDNAVGSYYVQQNCLGAGDGDNPAFYVYICIPAFQDRGPSGNWNNSFFAAPSTDDSPLGSVTVGNFCQGANGGTTVFPGWVAWYKYNGLDNNNSAPIDFNGHPEAGCPSQNCGDTRSRYRFEEAKNAEPPIRVYDYNHPPADEDSLNLVAGSDPDTIYRLTCNNFTQTIDSSGLNMAWSARTSINTEDPIYTPPYFVRDSSVFYGKNPYNIDRYGRNREDIPFGAAVWPESYDLLSSEPIKLRNQYSKKNNEEIFAGRPYGCNSTSGSGCTNIGYCSLDPSVYCLTSGAAMSSLYNLSLKSCADGGYGTCVPLWASSSPLNNLADPKKILKTLFLRAYSEYSYQNGAYAPSPNSPYDEDANAGSCGSTRPQPSYSNIGDSIGSFCAIYPKVSNISLKFNNEPVIGANPFNIQARGVYQLEFNTEVNSEQQPLREIRIDWGDNEPTQVITGQDHHPSASTPHVFYHFYREANPSATIQVKIFDNWGRYNN